VGHKQLLKFNPGVEQEPSGDGDTTSSVQRARCTPRGVQISAAHQGRRPGARQDSGAAVRRQELPGRDGEEVLQVMTARQPAIGGDDEGAPVGMTQQGPSAAVRAALPEDSHRGRVSLGCAHQLG